MKIRLDQYLTDNGLASGRDKAKALIMSGIVYVNDQKSEKAGALIQDTDKVEVRGNTLKYVSRGGLKLEKAMDTWCITLNDKICMDIGASTGGFTDCMLQSGAKKVFSVDVGYGQLAWSLRNDERVYNMERTNIRYVTCAQIGCQLDFASIDVSFISLKLVLPVLFELLREGGQAVCLIKPQFEAGRGKVGKNGVVREKSTHLEVLENTLAFTKDFGFSVLGVDFSPIKGPKGNIEYLMYIEKNHGDSADISLAEIVDTAHIEAH